MTAREKFREPSGVSPTLKDDGRVDGDVEPMSTAQRILHEASLLFIENGFSHTALSSIAAKLGVTKAALYYHYKSKDEILLALVDPLLSHVDQLLITSQQDRAAGNADLRQLLARYADVLVSDRRAALIIRDVNVNTHPAIAPRITHHSSSLLALVLDDSPSIEEEVRAVSALIILQRGLVAQYGWKEREVPMVNHREMLVRIAVNVLEDRFDD
jgi:AcrR family transcriptional regulator